MHWACKPTDLLAVDAKGFGSPFSQVVVYKHCLANDGPFTVSGKMSHAAAHLRSIVIHCGSVAVYDSVGWLSLHTNHSLHGFQSREYMICGDDLEVCHSVPVQAWLYVLCCSEQFVNYSIMKGACADLLG